MVRLTRIYTRGGDAGETSLGDGSRVAKHSLRVTAYGTVDEANAAIGLARLHCSVEGDAMLARIQNDLFDLGADLATPHSDDLKFEPLRIQESQVLRLEAEVEALNEKLTPLNSFILPGGTPAAAHLHLARAIARRAERAIVALADVESISPEAIKFANRLSDLLFVAARYANDQGKGDLLWKPGANR